MDDSPQPRIPRRDLARVLGVALGFAATALACLVATTRLGWTALDPVTNPERSQRVLAYLERPVTEDVLIVGSSRVAGGLHADLLQERLARRAGEDRTLYKLGIPGLRPWSLAELVDRAIALRPPKRLLVVAVETRFFCRPVQADAAGGDGGAVDGEWVAEDAGASALSPFAGLRAIWSAWWVFEPAVRGAALAQAGRLGEYRTDAEKFEHLGRLERLGERSERDNFVLPDGMVWRWSEPDETDQVGWRRALDGLAALPCEVVFVRMPLVEGFDERHMAEPYARFAAEVLPSIAARGFRYDDLNRPPFPRRRGLFFSLTHLDYEGARQASRAFVDEVLVPALAE